MATTEFGLTSVSNLPSIFESGEISSAAEATGIVHKFILNQKTPELQLIAVEKFLNLGEQASEVVGAAVTEAWAVLLDLKLWRSRYQSEAEAVAALDSQSLRSIRAGHGNARRRKEKAIKIIRASWGDDVADFDLGFLGETALENIAAVSKSLTYSQAIHCAWSVTIGRLERGQKGRASSKKPEKKDWQIVRNMTPQDRATLLSQKTLRRKVLSQFNLSISDLVLAPPLPGLSQKRKLSDALGGSRSSKRKRRSKEPTMTENDSDTGGDSKGSDERSTTASTTASSESEPGYFESTNESDSDGSESQAIGPGESIKILEPELSGKLPCSCIKVGVDRNVVERVVRKSQYRAGADTESAQTRLLGQFISKDKSLLKPCRYHLSGLAAKLGFQTKKLKHADLAYRLGLYWENRGDILNFRKQPGKENWWRYHFADRPKFLGDALGVYSEQPKPSLPLHISETLAELIMESIAPGSWHTFFDTGNLVLKGFFEYIWNGVEIDGSYEAGIATEVAEEFNMYLHHQAERNGVPNKGWLRTMFYSLTQQLVRQDLGYWMVYVALRPDRNPYLVSYPYYAKYAIENDATAFRHIDLNVNKYLESGRGKEIIQGSVSFDDETKDGCTELVLGFHKKIGDWWEKVKARGDSCDGWVTGLGKRWKPEDDEMFGVFKPMPCQRGDARITMPEIPHGSTGPAPKGSIRRTVLPWFVGLRSDMETLDTEESDSWSTLLAHHTSQTAPRLTPSGLQNNYGPPPFKFPASVQLILRSRVSSALVCRASWDDAMVRKEARVLLDNDREMAWKAVLIGRKNALQEFKKAWKEVREAEIEAYGERSYFRRKER